MRSFLRVTALLFILLVTVLLVNTFRLTSHQLTNVPPAAPIVIPDSAIQHLAGAVRIPTVSFTDYTLTDTTQFDKFLIYIKNTYPLVHQRLKRDTFNQYGLLYEWKGSNPALKPMMLMAHYDVVPVIQGTQGMWKRPPFGGIIEGVVERVKQVIENDSITVSILGKGNNPVAISDPESPTFLKIHQTIKSIFPDVAVAPYVMLGATDSKFYAGLTPAIYRFSPLPLNDAETQSIHGTNERIRVKDYENSIRFYVALIHNSQK